MPEPHKPVGPRRSVVPPGANLYPNMTLQPPRHHRGGLPIPTEKP
nr:MAG TPA: hypothetical protein [Caudoviricetes sp.]